ncbi:MAG: protein adenylyltransferase SelO [Gemmatimonadales bacterium]
MPRPLAALHWDNSFARLPETFHQRVVPTPIPDPYLVAFNPDAAALLELDPAAGTTAEFLSVMSGGGKTAAMDPVAAVYAGHQFGVWVPELGDGRAILLGEVLTSKDARWEVQLKGAGMTRFSRMGDGRAVLRSAVREYLASEAMAGLGIPTTRALSITGSTLPVYRERVESAAVLVRLAPSHVRFGSFELFASRGMRAEVEQLADYIITLHFPELLPLPAAERYATWYREVVDRTARLMAQWTAVGFAHGVMNSDNMSILGLTIDYGPYGWLDSYDPGFICNHSDHAGRYAFDQQPRVGLWNCSRLGEALHPLVNEDAALAALESYRGTFEAAIDAMMRAKLGLRTIEAADLPLQGELFGMLSQTGADYTRCFRALSHFDPSDPLSVEALRDEVGDVPALDLWLARYAGRLEAEGSITAERVERMLAVNPKFVLRNWIAQEAIEHADRGDFTRIETVRRVMAQPFAEHAAHERFAQAPPAGSAPIVVSCSS